MMTLTPAEYAKRRRHGYAGTRAELSGRDLTDPDVFAAASHWTLVLVPGVGTCLTPATVEKGEGG